MADLLTIGLSGVKAYATAMSTVADNIANAQTPGFAARTTTISEMPGATNSVFYTGQVTPSGARATGISRSADAWLVDNARATSGDAGRTNALSNWMQTSEAALSSESSGVAASVTAVFTNADQLAADPSSASLRQTFLQSVADVATAFNRSAKSLSDVAGNLADDATTMAAVVNTDLTALATVNTGLLRSTPNSSAQASLLDQRDQLLDEIGGKVGVSATFGVGGTVALKLAAPGTPDLLNGQQISPLHIITQADGTVSVLAGGNAVVPSGGALAGLQAAAADLAQRRSALDQLAVRFGAQVNAQQAAGVDLSGQPGALLYDVAGGTAATLGALKVTADQIAAADSSSTNGNMLAYANLRGTGGIEAGWALLVAGQSQATASANAQHAAASALNDAAQTARSLRSGVDLNQQAADLLRYQQAYQASAKVLQTAKETLQAILNIS